MSAVRSGPGMSGTKMLKQSCVIAHVIIGCSSVYMYYISQAFPMSFRIVIQRCCLSD